MYKDNMQCRLCKSGEDETQEQLEKSDFKKEMGKNLDLEKVRLRLYFGEKSKGY